MSSMTGRDISSIGRAETPLRPNAAAPLLTSLLVRIPTEMVLASKPRPEVGPVVEPAPPGRLVGAGAAATEPCVMLVDPGALTPPPPAVAEVGAASPAGVGPPSVVRSAPGASPSAGVP